LTRRHKQAFILVADALLVPLTFFLTILLVYGSIWPQAQLNRLEMLFPALAMVGALASLATGLPRIKLKTYASLAANGIGSFAAIVGGATLVLGKDSVTLSIGEAKIEMASGEVKINGTVAKFTAAGASLVDDAFKVGG